MATTTKARQTFSDTQIKIDLPNQIEHQLRSWKWFTEEALDEIFAEINPIEDYTSSKLELRFLSYHFEDPKMVEKEAKANNVTFEAPLKAVVELTNKVTGEVKEQEIYLGDYPVMTDRGTFVINGAERVVVSQLIRSPGVSFTRDLTGSRWLYGAKVMPGRGAWLEFETASSGAVFVKIDRRRKIPVTTFLRALGYATDKEIKELFAHVDSGEFSNIEATLEKDTTKSQNDALIEVFRRLRPGDLATVENAKSLIENMFFNFKRFDFTRVGRYKLNKRLSFDVPNTVENRIMRLEDLTGIIGEIVRLNHTQEPADDIDSLSNRRVKLVGELVQRQFRIGLLRMERNAKDRMSMCDIETVTPGQLINARPVVAAVREFFASSQLSQFMDQENPLSELAHKRRLSSMGPGGLTRERAGFEVRDVHATHYGRICTVETPEGAPIGLVLNMAAYARVNDFGFLETPYLKVINAVVPKDALSHIASQDIKDKSEKVLVKAGSTITKSDVAKLSKLDRATVPVKARVTDEVVYLDASDEQSAVIASAGTEVGSDSYFVNERVSARKSLTDEEVDANEVTHRDSTDAQIIGAVGGLIPFIEKDSPARALIGCSQQKQAMPLIKSEAPLVGTGIEDVIAQNSGQVILADESGEVLEADANKVVVKYKSGQRTYYPQHFMRTNNDTCINQKVVVIPGQKVKKGDSLVEGMSIDDGELALGKNLLVAFMPWSGYNFEDALVISQRLVKDDTLSSIHITDYTIEVRETKLGPEIVTADIPNVSEESLRHLDEYGVVTVGAEVHPGDILVGKITPKGEQELSSEERLLRAIFGEKAKDVRDSSLRLPTGRHGKIVEVRTFSKESGHELKAGIIQQIQIFVAQMRKIAVGDKLAGRHGNKGVIARILPEEDMPFMEDGTPVDIVLNPLGVPSRMNIGQLFETYLGMAARSLGIKIATPSFNGVPIEKIQDLLVKAGFDEDGKVQLYDGRNGEAFDERTTVGSMYVLKLSHMIADKIHARATGPYTMVTQQPLGGKAQNGGQRFGEMEVWALEAYGAANTLQEMLTIKSDDVYGRSKAYEAIVKGEPIQGPKVPESFNVLVKELQGLGLEVDLVEQNKLLDAEEVLESVAIQEDSDPALIAPDDMVNIDLSDDAVVDQFQVLDSTSDSGTPAASDASDSDNDQDESNKKETDDV